MPSVAGDPELARKLEEACPVDIFAASEAGVEVVRGEPGRVRALRALPGRRAGRDGHGSKALRRNDARPLSGAQQPVLTVRVNAPVASISIATRG